MKIIRGFHSSSYVFTVFYQNFLESTTRLERYIEGLKTRPKAKVEKYFIILLNSESKDYIFTMTSSTAGHVTLKRSVTKQNHAIL